MEIKLNFMGDWTGEKRRKGLIFTVQAYFVFRSRVQRGKKER